MASSLRADIHHTMMATMELAKSSAKKTKRIDVGETTALEVLSWRPMAPVKRFNQTVETEDYQSRNPLSSIGWKVRNTRVAVLFKSVRRIYNVSEV